jgi:hypothetical protein
MAEYIEREAAIKAIYDSDPNGIRRTLGFNVGQIEEALRAVPAVSVPQWISVKDRLPKVETEVLVACDRNGYRFVCPAIYEDGTVLTQDSIWNWYELENYGTYSEENDDYFVPQGWWENRQFTPDDIYNSPVDCAVTDWMPLPKLPKKGGADNG